MSKSMEILISRWLTEGVISQPQAERMQTDALAFKKERSSRKLVTLFATIGALLLGVGAFLFMAANWWMMSSLVKVITILLATAAAYYGGYVVRYEKANYPLVGNALLFLGSMLFGVSIFLIAQIYHVNANSHALVLVWLAGILPLVYCFQNRAIAGLSTILLYIWIGLYVFRGFTVGASSNNFIALPALYLVSSIFMFSLGGIHSLKEEWRGCARVCRLISLKVAMISLFLLTFKVFSGEWHHYLNAVESLSRVTSQFRLSFALFYVAAIVGQVIMVGWNTKRDWRVWTEIVLGCGILGLTGLYFYFPLEMSVYTVLYNVAYVAMVLAILVVGHRTEDMKLINLGLSSMALFVMVRYFDFFWDLMPRSIFFMIGGLILVVGGVAMERQRRVLSDSYKESFKQGGHLEA